MSVCQCGVNIDSVNADGDSALQCAIKHGCLLTSIMLLSHQHAMLYVSSLLHSIQVSRSVIPPVRPSTLTVKQEAKLSLGEPTVLPKIVGVT